MVTVNINGDVVWKSSDLLAKPTRPDQCSEPSNGTRYSTPLLPPASPAQSQFSQNADGAEVYADIRVIGKNKGDTE